MIPFPGDKIFYLKDTEGVPFALLFMMVEQEKTVPSWDKLIEAARSAGWYDYQIYDSIVEGLNDSQCWPGLRAGIIHRLKQYLLLTKEHAR